MGQTLNGIICQVDILILRLDVELLATSSNVTLFVNVTIEDVINPSDEHVAADVEFAALIQEGKDVALEDDRTWGFFGMVLLLGNGRFG
jgi:hypothetical protein